MTRIYDEQLDRWVVLEDAYGEEFREQVRAGAKSSASVIVPLLMRRFQPRSVVDVGCGEGWFAFEFQALGRRVLGLDIAETQLVPSKAVDLTQEWGVEGRFDLALCLEVGEHLPHGSAGHLVKNLCALSDTVVFSAAIPGQGGTDHINEQWPTYWRGLFEEQGYEGSGDLRWEIWEEAAVMPWYAQNLLIFSSSSAHVIGVGDGCPAVIHPDLWKWKCYDKGDK